MSNAASTFPPNPTPAATPQTPAPAPPARTPPARGTVPLLGCAFTLSFLLNILCGGIVLLSCFGLFFNLGGLTSDLSASAPLGEHLYSGNAGAKDKVAIVTLDGIILEGFLGYTHKQIEQAAKDKNVKAVVFRINSPGGSITGSDDLYRRLVRLRKGDEQKKYPPKPLVVSMGSIAASGGYYVAMPAEDNIFAEETTLTGSIGVYAAFPDLSGFGKEYGIGMNVIKQGEVKASGMLFTSMTAKEKAVWQDMVNQSYDQFLKRVEDGREALRHKEGAPRQDWPLLHRFRWEPTQAGPPDQDKPPLPEKDATRYLADGGIYTAKDALEHKLIDRIGTLEKAIDRAKELAGLGDNFKAIEYEKPKTLRDLLLGTRAPQPGSALDPARLKNGLAPRLWYLAPGYEVSGLFAAAQAE